MTMSRATLSTSLLSLGLLFGSTAIALADGDVVKESTASDVTVKATPDGNYETTTVNRRFETDVFDTAAHPGTIAYQLLEIEETHVFTDGPDTDADMKTAKVHVIAYPITKQGKGAALFTIDANGDEVKVDGPYLTVTTWGCCAEGPTYGVYSLETGAYLFNATGNGLSGDWITMNAKGGAERIVAYHLAPTEADDVVLKGAENAVIAISYATPAKPLQRILVTVPKAFADDTNNLIDWSPKFELINGAQPNDTTHMWVDHDGDPATLFTGATIRLTLDAKTRIEIPLVGDRLKLDGAKLPKGFALVEIQP